MFSRKFKQLSKRLYVFFLCNIKRYYTKYSTIEQTIVQPQKSLDTPLVRNINYFEFYLRQSVIAYISFKLHLHGK